ncbi:Ethanolaminephosphotransferase 1 [Orchesella cincta]|uniref:Ethanolaminephosphotransferase 1 n=1 Tax=Orchesella cincta TaxID=48709 RepID=A0A1D2N9D0_ORCCI|nr:Ethanolaminephosphotransferase 1 [Orchesella cincta]
MGCCKMEVQYLTPDHLQGFDNYKYSSVDTSPLSNYVMHPFWNAVVKICPMWIAPNLLTFTGFLFTVANFILLSIYDYHFYAGGGGDHEYPPVPSWVWFLAAFNLFMSHTLDGIDGKQARRTGTSGPLGELFDHGLDSWTTVFIPTGMYSVFGRGHFSISIMRMFFVYWNVFYNFLFSHWEKYNTGVLYLPWGYDASMVGCFIVFICTGFGGHDMWKFNLPGGYYTCGDLVEVVLYAGSIGLSMPVAIYNVFMSYRHGTGKMRPFFEMLRPLYSTFVLFIATTLWVCLSPTNILLDQPRIFFYMVGTVFSHICCKLIVAQMSTTRCEGFNWILFPITALTTFSLVFQPGLAFERIAVYALALLSTLTQIHYGVCVVRQMCRHFRIECFKIKLRED